MNSKGDGEKNEPESLTSERLILKSEYGSRQGYVWRVQDSETGAMFYVIFRNSEGARPVIYVPSLPAERED